MASSDEVSEVQPQENVQDLQEVLAEDEVPKEGVPDPAQVPTGTVPVEKWLIRYVLFYLMTINLACLVAIVAKQSTEVRLVALAVLTSSTTACVPLLRRVFRH